jgi:hypothetical protein
MLNLQKTQTDFTLLNNRDGFRAQPVGPSQDA